MSSDVPSPPEDISVHEICMTSCLLKWKKPKDDGGMPITSYIIERQDLALKCKHQRNQCSGFRNCCYKTIQFKKQKKMYCSRMEPGRRNYGRAVFQVRRVDQQEGIQIPRHGRQ